MDNHSQTFKEEAYELLAELETSLLELEERPDDADLIGRVFRAMHTIKGSGAMFGFDEIAAFTHNVETVFDLVRNGELKVTKELIDLTLAARDQITAMLGASDSGDAVDEEVSRRLLEGFRSLIPIAGDAPAAATSASTEPVQTTSSRQITYRVRFIPDKSILTNGTNIFSLLREVAELGASRVVVQTAEVPPIDELEPEYCYIYWDIILTTSQGMDAIKDVFIFVEDACELRIDTIDDGSQPVGETYYKRLGDILLERGDMTVADLQRVLAEQKRIGEMLVEASVVPQSKVQSALVEQEHVKEVRNARQLQETASSIRVPADKLDILVNLVGEMVTVQARLSQTANQREDAEILAIAEEVERLTAELRDNTLNIRMLPIGTTFSKFQRLVRDLSLELGKEIEMVTDGGETELDKTVIEKLNDPLVHIIRNSIDHGIEQPDAREQGGKPRKGTVHLSATHSGDSVLITIKDDGGGLNREAIRAKAIERGIIAANADLTDKELFGLIFAAGFSTAKQVTSVSGRGVGMDVVKQSIEALRGTIDITSKEGEGTTITLRIPLTLAIIESLMVKIGDDHYVMPLAIVQECIELSDAEIASGHGRDIINVRGRLVPYIPLRERFSICGEPPGLQQIVIIENCGSRVGFVVDHVVGEHQTVIKSLGRAYQDVEGVSGATILGDGSVALILDVPKIIEGIEQECLLKAA